MFNLKRSTLIRVIVSQPLLLTSSIDRNLEIANFLSEDCMFTKEEIKSLVSKLPLIAMTPISVLSAAWSVLLDVYKISQKDAKKCCLRFPRLLTKSILNQGSDRFKFLNEDLVMSKHLDKLHKMILYHPAILVADVEYYLKPNAAILIKVLKLSNSQLSQMATVLPPLLMYNPGVLETHLKKILRFLNGLDEYKFDGSEFENDDDDVDRNKNISLIDNDAENIILSEDDVILNDVSPLKIRKKKKTAKVKKSKEFDILFDELLDGNNSDDYIQEDRGLDMIADIVSLSSATKSQKKENLLKKYDRRSLHIQSMEKLTVKSERYMKGNIGTGAAAEIEAIRMILTSCATMSINKEVSINMVRNAPWLIAYRIERSKRVIAVLAVSLGMAKAEVAKCIRLYPRILCLSPDGKLNQLLRYLAEVAAAFLDRKYKNISPNIIEKYMKLKNNFYETSIIMDGDIYDDKILEKMEDDMVRSALINRRSNPIRTMVRYLIIKYPLILGISLERISDRYDELSEYKDVEWSDLIPFLRRSKSSQAKWIDRYNSKKIEEKLFMEWKKKNLLDLTDNDNDV